MRTHIKRRNIKTACGGALIGLVFMFDTLLASTVNPATDSGSLWAHSNLLAWGVAPFDDKQRGVLARSEMLQSLDFHHIAYNWRERHVPTFDEEIDCLQAHGIDIVAWALYVQDEPGVPIDWKHYGLVSSDMLGSRKTSTPALALEGLLEMFKRHHIHPQLWLIQRVDPKNLLKSPIPKEDHAMSLTEERDRMTRLWRADLSRVPQDLRIRQEADRVAPLALLAAPYGVHVELYNHNGWYGMEDNELAVIEQLKKRGVSDVGMVYNFDHARDALHDDTAEFSSLWKRIRPYVVAVNVSGTAAEPQHLYPSQGDREFEMMRTIQNSGWTGPVGLNTETGGDAQVTLEKARTGLDWLATKLARPGSEGQQPLLVAH